MRYVLPLVIAFTMSAAVGCAHKSPSGATATTPTRGNVAAAPATADDGPRADTRGGSVPPAANAGPVDPAGHRVIVRIASRDKTLVVSSTGRGPVYSVVRATGETLLSEGSLDDLRRVDPQLYQHVKSAIVADVDAHDGTVPEFGHSSAVTPALEPIGIMSAR